MNQRQTIVSTIVQGIVAINMILIVFGVTKFEGITEDMIYQIVSLVATVVAWGYGLWKNHNFTNSMVVATKLGRKSKEKLKKHDATVYDRMVGEIND